MAQPTRGLYCAAAALLLSACGGGSDAPAPPPAATEAVPASASQSSAGLVAYVTDLSAAAADDKEPLDLSQFNPAQPDDTEPQALP